LEATRSTESDETKRRVLMANPKHRISRTRRDKRRSHHGLVPPGWSLCTSCFEPKPPHQVCPHCGSYKGREVVQVEDLD